MMALMTLIAVVLNGLLVSDALYLLGTKWTPSDGEVMLAMLAITAPICSIIALLVSTDDDYLSLYFTRKALEEKKKIEALKAQDQRLVCIIRSKRYP